MIRSSTSSFSSVLSSLSARSAPLLPPGKPLDPSLTTTIAALQVHPTLEALLHLYNHDLPSAHFLVRHMQGSPAWEGMYIHGLLHRIEGDYANCLAWYTDVSGSEAFQGFFGDAEGDKKGDVDGLLDFVPSQERKAFGAEDGDSKLPPQKSARVFIRAIEALRRMPRSTEAYEKRRAALERVSAAELEALTTWCVRKFGTGTVEDATGAWSQNSEEIKDIGQRMVSGDEGYRKF